MRIAITGATGNVGTALVAALAAEPGSHELVGIARRPPPSGFPLARFVAADVAHDDLADAFAGADAVVHLAWEIQPSRDRARLWRTNVLGSKRVLEAATAAGATRIVAASSLAAYGPGPKDRLVDESWPRSGIATSTYSLHKATLERQLDLHEQRNPEQRVIRLRPALIFQRASASEQRRLFAGPFVPSPLLRPGRLPLLPDIAGLRFQAVHSADVAQAYRLALLASDARGAYNVAAEPVLDMSSIARARRARTIPVPRTLARSAFAAAYGLRLHPAEPSWLDLALETPLISPARIAGELGWAARHSALAAIAEVLDGMADGAGGATPPLEAPRGMGGRLDEIRGGVGRSTPGFGD
ncbi:MAG TPA: NAD-dependent epimerase/dehydratase family protein [Gaiellales bacterium]